MQDSSKASVRSLVITGSSTGIGAAAALELDRHGFRVFAGVRSEADGRRLQQSASSRLTPILLDVTDPGQICARAAEVAAAVGPQGLAGLVNNAGIVVVGPIEVVPLEALRRQFEVNVLGTVAVTQGFLPLLRCGGGRIINVSSGNGFMAPPYFGPYAASKAAENSLSDCLRVELRRWHIPVSIVVPGSVATPIWQKSLATADRLAGESPVERYELYREDLDAVRITAHRLAEHAMPAQHVAEVVLAAMLAPRPKALYIVGTDSRLMRMGSRFLPIWLRDRLLMRGLGLK